MSKNNKKSKKNKNKTKKPFKKECSGKGSKNEGVDFCSVVNEFVEHIAGIKILAEPIMYMMNKINNDARKKIDDFVKDYANYNKSKDAYIIPSEQMNKFLTFKNEYGKKATGVKIMPSSFIVMMVSQYDIFLGHLLRCLHKEIPEWFNDSNKTMTYEELDGFDSIDRAKEYIIEKEIETFLRKSHGDQFKWLENKFSISFTKIAIWPAFIELTERRNLFVHSDGIVSSHYLKICKDHKVFEDKEPPKQRAKLNVDPDYLASACDCLFEIGVKLSQIIWRKVKPTDTEYADDALNRIIYNLLIEGSYKLAIIISDFACEELREYSSDVAKKMFTVNRALSYKYNGDRDRCIEIIDSNDWSAAEKKFKLAVAVLRDDFTETIKIMREMGDTDIAATAYKEWPLFETLRKQEEFAKAFEDIFGNPFEFTEKSN